MFENSSLKQLVEKQLEEVKSESNYHLNPTDRYNLYKLLGESRLSNPNFFTHKDYFLQSEEWHRELIEFLQNNWSKLTKADQVLNWLAIITFKKVLSLWEIKEISGLQEVVEMAENLIKGFVKIEDVYWFLHGQDYCPDISELELENFALLFLYETATNTLKTIVFGGKKSAEDILAINDILFNDYGDYANSAVKAYTFDYKLGEYEFNFKKRLEFWEWWLTEAIPQAWELAHTTYRP
jgi:hypothetical protein